MIWRCFMAKKNILYPFDGYGNLINYTNHYQENGDYVPNQNQVDSWFGYRIRSNNPPTYAEIEDVEKKISVFWKPQREFVARAHIVDYHQGRSAFHFIVNIEEPGTLSEDDFWQASVPASSIMYLIDHVVLGKTTFLEWKFAKKGQNHFLVPIEKSDDGD